MHSLFGAVATIKEVAINHDVRGGANKPQCERQFFDRGIEPNLAKGAPVVTRLILDS